MPVGLFTSHDVSVWINEVEIGVWTSPGDYGDRRGKYTPIIDAVLFSSLKKESENRIEILRQSS